MSLRRPYEVRPRWPPASAVITAFPRVCLLPILLHLNSRPPPPVTFLPPPVLAEEDSSLCTSPQPVLTSVCQVIFILSLMIQFLPLIELLEVRVCIQFTLGISGDVIGTEARPCLKKYVMGKGRES